MSRPNILLFITHDTGRHLGCYGRGPATPNLDRMAAAGVCFTQAYCTAPQCSPSRTSLMTGLYPHGHGLIGLLNKGFRRTPGIPTLPDILAEAGYATYLFGFQHEAEDPASLGYQHVYRKPKAYECADVLPDLAAFLDSPAAREKPFYASVGVRETHRPFPHAASCRGAVRVPAHMPDSEVTRADVLDLNAVVETVDDTLGAILAALDRNGLAGRTLVIFTTDHGIAFPGAKATLFEPGIETALLMLGPADLAGGAFAGGRSIGAPVSNIDLMPTLLELGGAGARVPARLHGRSLLPLLSGAAEAVHACLFFEQTYHSGYDPLRAVRSGRHKLIKSFEAANRTCYFARHVDPSPSKNYVVEHTDLFRTPRPELYLFDLAADPLETNNLAQDPAHAAVRDEWLAQLEGWMRATGDPLLNGHVPPQPGAIVASDDQFDEATRQLTAEQYCELRGWGT
ncbi:MAG: sulfatase [Kiritimatiellae bacterium]|nr:sulfatase [Kiritimatiellia bacterium]